MNALTWRDRRSSTGHQSFPRDEINDILVVLSYAADQLIPIINKQVVLRDQRELPRRMFFSIKAVV